MTEEQDEKLLSRRARRRARAEREEPDEGASEQEDSGAGAREPDEEPSEAEAEASSEGPSAGDEAAAPAEPAPRKLSKSEKKRAKQEEKSATVAVRDRNRRLRELGAEKRSKKRERERQAAVARGLDASEMVDDALARGTHATVQFIRRHFGVLQWVVVLAIAGGIGWQIYAWRAGKTAGKVSDGLMSGVEAELGSVGESGNPDEAAVGARPRFDSDQARLEAAEKAYAASEKGKPGSGASILATLGRAGVAYDLGKFDEAKALYEKVQASELARHDADVRLRALEGVGLCLEAKGDAEGAMKVFKDLEKADEPGFSSLGMYHQARVHVTRGEKGTAKEILAKVNEKLAKERSPFQTTSYVEKASRDLMAIIDPTTAPASSYSEEQMDQLRDALLKDPTKLKKMLEDMGKLKVPELPPVGDPGSEPAPTPAPTGSEAP